MRNQPPPVSPASSSGSYASSGSPGGGPDRGDDSSPGSGDSRSSTPRRRRAATPTTPVLAPLSPATPTVRAHLAPATPARAPPVPTPPINGTWAIRFGVASTLVTIDREIDDLTLHLRSLGSPAPSPRHPLAGPRRPRPQLPLPEEAKRIQTLYRSDKKRAFREICTDSSPHCTIDKASLEAHFTRVHGPSSRVSRQPTVPHPVRPISDDPLSTPFTQQEVLSRLSRCKNTAPGPDGIRYPLLRRFDPDASTLTALFNAVLRIGEIPTSWKTSRTVLLFKKGDPSQINNWRPVSLSNTLGKLYSALLATRLESWAIREKILTSSQKGFLSYEGCSEHSFLLQSILQDARRRRTTVSVAFLDLSNAFGSLPFSTIFDSLEWAGLSGVAIDRIRQLYDGCYTEIRSSTGFTAPIPILAGVKQGCPLSPIIFNIAAEIMIRSVRSLPLGYTLHGVSHSILAYADDVAIVAESPADLQTLLDTVSAAATYSGLVFNQGKSASLSFHAATVTRERLLVQGAPIPSLGPNDSYDYLGVPIGHKFHPSAEKAISGARRDLKKIDESLLCPWQKAEALNIFVLSRLPFHLTHGIVKKEPLVELDLEIRRVAKRWLNLPQQASAELVYIHPTTGGLGILPLQDLADISQLSQAVRLMGCKDEAIQSLSRSVITQVASHRAGRSTLPTEDAIYLSGSCSAPFSTLANDVSSRWTRLRAATRRLRAKGISCDWNVAGDQLNLTVGSTVVTPATAHRRLRGALHSHFLSRLLAKKDQGKVFHESSASPHSNHYMSNGSFVSFCTWRFVHRARLNVLPLNGARRWDVTGDQRCRRCGYERETLPHVLNHCGAHTVLIQNRHNALVTRLVKAARLPGYRILTDSAPPLNPGTRPDIVFLDEAQKRMVCVDVATPFENGPDTLSAMHNLKRMKYHTLADSYRQAGYEVAVHGFVVGALGSWSKENEEVFRSLRVADRYTLLFRKLCVTETLKRSRDIYVTHITGQQQ